MSLGPFAGSDTFVWTRMPSQHRYCQLHCLVGPMCHPLPISLLPQSFPRSSAAKPLGELHPWRPDERLPSRHPAVSSTQGNDGTSDSDCGSASSRPKLAPAAGAAARDSGPTLFVGPPPPGPTTTIVGRRMSGLGWRRCFQRRCRA
jgi:hypothetical protein